MIAPGVAAGAAEVSGVEKPFHLLLGLHPRAPAVANHTVALPQTGLAPWQASRVLAYIDSNLDQPLKIDELAALARLSTSHFSHVFRRTFGIAPYGYILNRRMERARELLSTTDEPLAQVALRCGMTDQAHLSRLFKQQVGEPPSRWRRMRALG